MRLLRYTLILALFCAFTHTASAQDFKSAVGLRLGYPLSVSFKTFISETNALEAYVGYRSFGAGYNWISINGAYQIHNDIESVDGLQWYYGAGAGARFFSFDNAFIGDSANSTIFGINGYLGLQYTLADTPLTVTADWVPGFYFGDSYGGFGAGYGGLGVRYVLGR